MTPAASVVIATRNRGRSLVRLIEQLGTQALDAAAFEIVVVDDGSPEPVAPALDGVAVAPALRGIRIEWSGPALARHQGASMARGDVLVFLDDDMQVGPEFLAAHLAHHERTPSAVVLGRIQPDPGLRTMPVFERYHARQIDRWREGVLAGRVAPRGVHLCTGNVSMRRADYEAVGGFDASLQRSEDRELGIRLEQHGCAILHGDDAVAVHSSDHTDPAVWLRRAYLYGRFDHKIASMHPAADAHPWRYWSVINPLGRPIVLIALLWPWLGSLMARVALAVAGQIDRLAPSAAITLAALAYGVEYFRGLREECGSLSALRRDIRRSQGGRCRPSAWREFLAAVRADHDSVRHYRAKYNGEQISRSHLPLDVVRKVGFQMMVFYRVMRLLDAWRIPVLPMVASRLMRHLYGAEIHWRARLAPGVSIVHGVGLVISHAAEVGAGCILFQNVTLGVSVDAESGEIGAPTLGERVHVGPGATLIGPIVVGEGSKVAAGSVLMRSVPANSVVEPAAVVVRRRRGPRAVTARHAEHAGAVAAR